MSDQMQFALELEAIAAQSTNGSPPSPYVALQLLQSAHGDARLCAMASVILGHAWQHISEHDKAQMAFNTAISGFHALRCTREETDARILLGFSHLLVGEPLRALDDWSDALQQARRINDRSLCARVYLGVGQVYIGFGDDQAALGFNELALEMARRLEDDQLKCEALLNVASDSYRLKRYTYTLQCIAEAEKLLQTISNKIWDAEIVYYRGLVHTVQKYYPQAKAELETAYLLSEHNDNLWGKAHALTALGEVLLKMNDPDAGKVLLQAHALASSAGIARLVERCNLALIYWYRELGDDQACVQHYSMLLHQKADAPAKISARQQQRLLQLQARSRIRQLEAME